MAVVRKSLLGFLRQCWKGKKLKNIQSSAVRSPSPSSFGWREGNGAGSLCELNLLEPQGRLWLRAATYTSFLEGSPAAATVWERQILSHFVQQQPEESKSALERQSSWGPCGVLPQSVSKVSGCKSLCPAFPVLAWMDLSPFRR